MKQVCNCKCHSDGSFWHSKKMCCPESNVKRVETIDPRISSLEKGSASKEILQTSFAGTKIYK